MNETESHFDELKKHFQSKLLRIEVFDTNRIRLQVNQDDLLEVMEYLAINLCFTSLEAVSGLDWETHFEVVYHFDRWDGDPTVIQIHVQLEDRENPSISSVTSIWASANWHERELYDLFGINIQNHPNLKRLLLPEEWDEYEHKHISELYPMRREYKLPEKPYSFKPRPQ